TVCDTIGTGRMMRGFGVRSAPSMMSIVAVPDCNPGTETRLICGGAAVARQTRRSNVAETIRVRNVMGGSCGGRASGGRSVRGSKEDLRPCFNQPSPVEEEQ